MNVEQTRISLRRTGRRRRSCWSRSTSWWRPGTSSWMMWSLKGWGEVITPSDRWGLWLSAALLTRQDSGFQGAHVCSCTGLELQIMVIMKKRLLWRFSSFRSLPRADLYFLWSSYCSARRVCFPRLLSANLHRLIIGISQIICLWCWISCRRWGAGIG